MDSGLCLFFLTRKHFTCEFKRRKNVIELCHPLTTLEQQKHFSAIPSPQRTGTGIQRAMCSVNSHNTFLKIVLSPLRVAIICFIKSQVSLRTSIEKSSWQV